MQANFLIMLCFVAVLLGCKADKPEKVYHPRALVAGEDFNTYAKNDETPLAVFKQVEDGTIKKVADTEANNILTVKFRDTIVQIQPDPADKGNVIDKFAVAQFLNTQKTSLLVQGADSSGLIAPFYLLSLKNNQLDVVSLYRPSKGKRDVKLTKGMIAVGRSGYLINNDYFVTYVNAKVYTIKRQNPDERIQGEYFINSADKKTFVFLMDDAFYQVHYPSNETFTQPFKQAPSSKSALFSWVQANFSWQKNDKGISFLKQNQDSDRIVDIREFKN